MSYQLRFDDGLPIEVNLNKSSRSARVYSVTKKGTFERYCKIKYNKFGDIIFYQDYIGNWYDSKYFNFECPYNEYTIVCLIPNLFGSVVRVRPQQIAADLLEVTPIEPPRVNIVYFNLPSVEIVREENNKKFSEQVDIMSKYYNAPFLYE